MKDVLEDRYRPGTRHVGNVDWLPHRISGSLPHGLAERHIQGGGRWFRGAEHGHLDRVEAVCNEMGSKLPGDIVGVLIGNEAEVELRVCAGRQNGLRSLARVAGPHSGNVHGWFEVETAGQLVDVV